MTEKKTKTPRNNWQRKRAIRRLKKDTTITADTLLPTLRDALAKALSKADIRATVVHDVPHKLVKLTNMRHTKARDSANADYGLLVHYTPKGMHVVVFTQIGAENPMRLVFTKSGPLNIVLAELASWKSRNTTAKQLPPGLYRVVAEQLRNLADAAPGLIP